MWQGKCIYICIYTCMKRVQWCKRERRIENKYEKERKKVCLYRVDLCRDAWRKRIAKGRQTHINLPQNRPTTPGQMNARAPLQFHKADNVHLPKQENQQRFYLQQHRSFIQYMCVCVCTHVYLHAVIYIQTSTLVDSKK